MIKYKAEHYWNTSITEKDIIRETDKCVFYLNHRGKEDKELKESNSSKWFNTKQEAIEYNRAYLTRQVESVKLQLMQYESRLSAYNDEFPVV